MMAVLAGADVILMPPDVTQAIDAILRAVRDGRIPESRIDQSVTKLLRLKEEMGLHEEREVPLEVVPQVVGHPEAHAHRPGVAERSITLLRNQRNLLPLLGTRTARVMSVTFRSRTDVLASRYFDARLRETYPRLVTTRVDEQTNSAAYEDLERRSHRSNLVVVLGLLELRGPRRAPRRDGGVRERARPREDHPCRGVLREPLPDLGIPRMPRRTSWRGARLR